ncbi:MAG: hypothetical protein Q9175_005265 [Cornicularia normoerica]
MPLGLAALGFHDPRTALTPAKYLASSPTPSQAPAPGPTADTPKATNGAGQQASNPQPPPPFDNPSDPASDTPSNKPSAACATLTPDGVITVDGTPISLVLAAMAAVVGTSTMGTGD